MIGTETTISIIIAIIITVALWKKLHGVPSKQDRPWEGEDQDQTEVDQTVVDPTAVDQIEADLVEADLTEVVQDLEEEIGGEETILIIIETTEITEIIGITEIIAITTTTITFVEAHHRRLIIMEETGEDLHLLTITTEVPLLITTVAHPDL